MSPARNCYEQAIVWNADWFVSQEDGEGRIPVPADEYYGVPGDASLIGHAITVRTYAWYLTRERQYLESAQRSTQWLADRQDARGGWRRHAGYALDAAQCVLEGLASYERLTGDTAYHEALVRAADRMIEGTVGPDGRLRIGNLLECGEYAHFAFLAWRHTGLPRHRDGGYAILRAITSQFDEVQGFWNTVGEIATPAWMRVSRSCLGPLLRWGVRRLKPRGQTVARLSGRLLPLLIRGRGPQYAIGMMDAEPLLDTLDGRLELPELEDQTRRAVSWVETHCSGPVPGSFCESRSVPVSEAVYPLPALNDSTNASLWPSATVLLAYVGLDDPSVREKARRTADWIVAMQDADGGFWTRQDAGGRCFGGKYGNVNFYGAMSLWYYNWAVLRRAVRHTIFPAPETGVA